MMPFRPRNIGTKEDEEAGFVSETEDEYKATKEEALSGGGYLKQDALMESFGFGGAGGWLGGGPDSASSSSVGGGYGKKRVGEQSRGQMNLTSGQNRSILTGG